MATSAKRLLTQVRALHAEPVEDIALLPSDNPYQIDAFLFGPLSTPYADGAFRVRLTYDPSTYPSQPPAGLFLTKIYHPNVSLSGEICVNTLKRDWTSSVTVAHILTVVKCLLIHPGPDSALNEDAGRMLMDSFAEFEKVARMWTSVHAVKVDRALHELESEVREKVMLSVRTDGQQQRQGHEVKEVLSVGDVNKPGVHDVESGGGSGSGNGLAAKKVKTGDGATPAAITTTKRKIDAAKKKTLKRL